MTQKSCNERTFYVVQFIRLPSEGVDDLVCVPYTWLKLRKLTNQRTLIAYPEDEDPCDTRDRVKRKERRNEKWKSYAAIVKYESDSYSDAESWIATRILTKQSTKPELKKKVDEKRLKLDETAQSSNAVVNDAVVEPRSLKRKLSAIIQDNQSMECSSTEPWSKTQRTEQTKQVLRSPLKDVDKGMTVIYVEDQSQLVKKPDQNNSLSQANSSSNTTDVSMTAAKPSTAAEQSTRPNQSSYQEHTPDPNSLSNLRPKIVSIQSLKAVDDHKLLVNEVSSHKSSTSHEGLNSQKNSAPLYSHVNGSLCSIPIQKPVEKRCTSLEMNERSRPMKMDRNLDAQKPSNSIDQTRHLSTSSVEQLQVVTQNQSQNDPQVLRTHIGNNKDQTAPLNRIGMISEEIHKDERSRFLASSDPKNVLQSVNNVGTPSQQLPSLSRSRSDGHQNLVAHEQRTLTRSYQNQYLPTRQGNFQQEVLRSSTVSNTYDHRPTSQTANMRIPSSRQNSTHLSNPMYQTPELAQQRQMQLNQRNSQQQPTDDQSTRTNSKTKPVHFMDDAARTPVTESHLNAMAVACQTDECMLKETLSPVETTNNVDVTTNDSGCGSADKSTAVQNSTSRKHQTDTKVILEQQMLHNFGIFFTQIDSVLRYLRYVADMHDTLHSLFLDAGETYKKFWIAVKEFNSAQNSAGNASTSINVTPEVQPSSKERHTEVTASASSSTQNQLGNDVANKMAKRKHNKLYRLVLPPEYDACDTRWTLKYRTYLPGLVELIAQSGVYVSHRCLTHCLLVSEDCKSLAALLLTEVFNINALIVCSSMSEKEQASNTVGSNVRPELDARACVALVTFVSNYGLQHGWNTDPKLILTALHNMTQTIRSRYGVRNDLC